MRASHGGHGSGEVGDRVPALQHEVEVAGVGDEAGEQAHALLEGAGGGGAPHGGHPRGTPNRTASTGSGRRDSDPC